MKLTRGCTSELSSRQNVFDLKDVPRERNQIPNEKWTLLGDKLATSAAKKKKLINYSGWDFRAFETMRRLLVLRGKRLNECRRLHTAKCLHEKAISTIPLFKQHFKSLSRQNVDVINYEATCNNKLLRVTSPVNEEAQINSLLWMAWTPNESIRRLKMSAQAHYKTW